MGSGTARERTNWGTGTEISKKTDASLALSWSGGKDSALALLALRAELGRNPSALITTVTETYERISMHGVRRELLALQAQELGLPLVEVSIPLGCPNETYDARMHEVFASERLGQVTEVAFGDLFLEDVRAYREGRLAAAASADCSRSGAGTLPNLPATSSRPASKPCSSASMRASSTARSLGEAMTSACSPISQRQSILVGRTASSTPLSTVDRSSGDPSPAFSATSSSVTASYSLTCKFHPRIKPTDLWRRPCTRTRHRRAPTP
jgi:hypothetical protein